MIDLEAVTARWSAPFNDPGMIDELPAYAARQLLHQLVADLHAILTDPTALEAVEAVRALGAARAKERDADARFRREVYADTNDARETAMRASDSAEVDVYTIADRLHAARKGE